jgi:hypothetical protein
MRAGFRPREPRIRVHVPARMCADGTWHDITILNISTRGLMARTNAVPQARSYIEIRRGANVTIVGKVVWQDDRHFGIRTQDRIGISMLSDDGSVTAAPHDPVVERRAEPRPRKLDPAEAFERSRQRAALFQFVALTGGGVVGAFVLASVVMDVLGKPFMTIASHLG